MGFSLSLRPLWERCPGRVSEGLKGEKRRPENLSLEFLPTLNIHSEETFLRVLPNCHGTVQPRPGPSLSRA